MDALDATKARDRGPSIMPAEATVPTIERQSGIATRPGLAWLSVPDQRKYPDDACLHVPTCRLVRHDVGVLRLLRLVLAPHHRCRIRCPEGQAAQPKADVRRRWLSNSSGADRLSHALRQRFRMASSSPLEDWRTQATPAA